LQNHGKSLAAFLKRQVLDSGGASTATCSQAPGKCLAKTL
jgi:hypothetical protein